MKLNIIGKARSWKLAPLTGESWGINTVILRRPLDVMFEMHEDCDCPKSYQKAVETKTPSYSLEEYEVEGLKFKKYPIREILDEFKQTLFDCSFDYMLALAIYKKYEQIDVYGIDLFRNESWSYQRPSVEFWRGIAVGRGIDIQFHGETTIGRCRKNMVYGYNIKQKDFNGVAN